MSNSPEPFPVLQSVKPVVEQSEYVRFHADRLEAALEEWKDAGAKQQNWRHPCHFFDGTEETARWIFVLDVLNHCFWPSEGEPLWSVNYRSEWFSGYWGLAAALKRAVEAGIPLTEASFLARITRGDLCAVFSGTGQIPMIEERVWNLREAGRVLLDQWQGNFIHLLESADKSAKKAIALVTTSFASFRDEAQYRGKTVYFWKRAQILVSDLWTAFEEKGWGAFHDVGMLTAFADYKLPQVLRRLGIISYAPELARRVDSLKLLRSGSPEEVEIRAMTIWAVEALRQALRERGQEVTSAQIDAWLWGLGQSDRYRQKPYHRCRTIFY